ncbi:MAG: hypothetical protein ACR2HV_00800 [Acidimicrobiales bacterium]
MTRHSALGPSGPLSGTLGPSGPLSGTLGPSGPLSGTLLAAIGAVILVVGLSACDTGGDGTASPGSTASSPATTAPPMPAVLDLLPGLCTARDRAASDVNSARVTFYAQSHDPLHTIARDLEPIDRALAARLLEAKQAVEADLNTVPAESNTVPADANTVPADATAVPTAPTLVADLDFLIVVTAQSLERLSIAGEQCA